MLYLRNTNQLQSLDRGIQRGPAALLISSSVSASYTTNSSSLFVLLNDAVTKLSTTSSATTNFLAAPNSVVSASIAGTAISSSNSVTLFISASDGSLLYNQNTTGSALNTNFTVGSNVRYTISSSVSAASSSIIPTGNGLFRTQYIGYFAGNPAFFDTAVTASVSANGPNTVTVTPGFTGSAESINNVSVQWLGYFTPTTTENYTFFAFTDDAMFMWIGNDAINNYTTSSKNIGEPGLGPLMLTGSVVSLTSGSFYPMRIQFGEAGGGEYLSMSYSTPTISKTNIWTPNMYYNTSSRGF
jgi:hypothetical protein